MKLLLLVSAAVWLGTVAAQHQLNSFTNANGKTNCNDPLTAAGIVNQESQEKPDSNLRSVQNASSERSIDPSNLEITPRILGRVKRGDPASSKVGKYCIVKNGRQLCLMDSTVKN